MPMVTPESETEKANRDAYAEAARAADRIAGLREKLSQMEHNVDALKVMAQRHLEQIEALVHERAEMGKRLSDTQARLVDACRNPCSVHGNEGTAEGCYGCFVAEPDARAAAVAERERLAKIFMRTPNDVLPCHLVAAVLRFVPTRPGPLSQADLGWVAGAAASFFGQS